MDENGKLPAHPMPIAINGFGEMVSAGSVDWCGLTKREAFAMAAMQGMAAGRAPAALLDGPCLANWAGVSVALADALLAELAKKPA